MVVSLNQGLKFWRPSKIAVPGYFYPPYTPLNAPAWRALISLESNQMVAIFQVSFIGNFQSSSFWFAYKDRCLHRIGAGLQIK